jgi:hypothetical protein
MPLPDATKDQRIYQLLKNIDLGNLTFDQFQDAAQTVFAEPEAEDTLRRIVLVNLARMAVAGDWAGLTTAAAGGGGMSPGTPTGYATNYNFQQLATTAGYGTSTSRSGTNIFGQSQWPHFFPTMMSTSGEIATMTIYCSTAVASSNYRIGFYDADDNGNPRTLLGYGDFDCSSTGTLTVSKAAMSATVTTVRDGIYYYAIVRTTGGSSPAIYGSDSATGAVGVPALNTDFGSALVNFTSTGDLEATITLSEVGIRTGGIHRPLVALTW